VEFRILGAIEALHDGHAVALGGPKQRAVLACLLLQANHLVSSEALIDTLWGEDPPDTARNTLQGYVSHLRHALEDGALEGRPPGYVLHVQPGDVDAIRFDELVREARGLGDEPARASALLSEALGLWRGPALADVVQEASLAGEAARLEESRLTAIEDRVEADLELGRHAQLVGELDALTGRHPLRERLWGQLMLALYGAGQQADALRAFQRLRSLLGEELGLDPSPRLTRLQERILLHDPALVPSRATGPAAGIRNPFKGLRPFDEEDAEDFFGREELVGRLVGDLEASTRLIALVGPSGSGKSSVVNAGLIPAIRATEGWVVARMVPGRHPFEELRAALRGIGLDDTTVHAPEGRRLLLVVDQFEELFVIADEADRAPFLAALTEATTDPDELVAVVLTLRADLYDRPLVHATFAPSFIAGAVTILPMSAAEIERAVAVPARRVGIDVDPALLADLIADTTDQPSALPLLQYALTELFDRRTGPSLTSEEYRTLGGVHGILSRRSEDLYGHLDEQQRKVWLQVFLRLVRLGPKAGDASRRVPIGELTALDLDPVALSEVLESFGRHRLLTFDRDPVTGDATVQVAHEALLTRWERLAEWIERHRTDLSKHESFAHAVEEWEASGRNADYLLTGSRLAEFESWARETTLRLTDGERAYLEDGIARKRVAEVEELAQREKRRALERSARTRLIALIVAVAMVLVAATLGSLAWLAGRPADAVLVFGGADGGGFEDTIVDGFDGAVSEFGVRAETVVAPDERFQSEFDRLSEEGVDLVIGYGADCINYLDTTAVDHPDTRYFMLDCLGQFPPNVAQIWFASEEGSFLAGAAAALKSETGTVGFIGGVNLPLIWAFQAGFEAGAHYVDPTIEVVVDYLTDHPDFSGFRSPELASRAAEEMYRDGADVVYHAAGFSGIGVFQAAVAESEAQGRHLWAIGVDTDQYRAVMGLNPDFDPGSWQPHILTSMVKRYDRATYAGVEEYSQGRFSPGVRMFGLAEGGVDIVYTGGFIDEFRPMIEELRAKIIAGEIEVPSVPTDRELEVPDWPPELIPP
jgi:basic membrane lipoprotein Med (substrate-binding protein (PBP1-ABC) superfamily)/DNA-binding SARP family transcriptional activator